MKWSDEEYKRYKLEAESGDVDKQIWFGWAFYEGKFVKRDLKESLYWLEKAASSNDGEAVFRYSAVLSVYGDKTCIELLEKLDKSGFFPASYELGGHYFAGAYVKKDTTCAMNYWQKAARSGHLLAQVNIIKCCGNSQTPIGRLLIRLKIFKIMIKVARISLKNPNDHRLLGSA